MHFIRRATFALITFSFVFTAQPSAAAESSIDPDRVAEIARLLPAEPEGLGPTIDDRAAWNKILGEHSPAVIERAGQWVGKPIPLVTDELFLDYRETGNRTRCQKVYSTTNRRLVELVLGECAENKGRFLPEIEQTIRAISEQKSWVLPAHDYDLSNFEQTQYTVMLRSSATGWQFAEINRILGDKIKPEIRKLIRDQLEARIFKPYIASVETGKPRHWWLTGKNNWNAVCHAGVVGAALATIEDPKQRAWFVAAAEHSLIHYFAGFTADGYCSEGLGYWNYGFGHFAMLAETVKRATDARLNWFDREDARRIAHYPARVVIQPGIYPAFADSGVGGQPSAYVLQLLANQYPNVETLATEREGLLRSRSLFSILIYGQIEWKKASATGPEPKPRDWFEHAGLLICRTSDGMSVAIKGGHNNEHHNHNDVGTFVVAIGDETPLLDPGTEVYTGRTFSRRRYDSKVINSLGHPVPVIAGQLQEPGGSAKAENVQTQFDEQADTLTFDYHSAYKVEALQMLRRQFVFDRAGRGKLTVTDTLKANEPVTFEMALVTYGSWRKVGTNQIRVIDGDQPLLVTIDSDGNDFVIDSQILDEDMRGDQQPARIGITLKEPVADLEFKVIITPE